MRPSLRLLVLCIYFVPPRPRNKPNHISITKKILLYVSCMRNIIYATSASENNRISLRNIFSWLMREKHSSSSDIIPFDCPNILTNSVAENGRCVKSSFTENHLFILIHLLPNTSHELRMRMRISVRKPQCHDFSFSICQE